MARRFFQPVTRRSRVVVAARYRCCAQPAASQHLGDGLKPSLEIAPPGATPNHSGCPLGERPYGLEDAQGGLSPSSLKQENSMRIHPTGNHWMEKRHVYNFSSAPRRHCAAQVLAGSPAGRLPLSHCHGFIPPWRFDWRTCGFRRFTSPCLGGPARVL